MLNMWDSMYTKCIQDPDESELAKCMLDLLEPCRLSGHSELEFCANFNNRPFELFRKCDSSGDRRARELYNHWAQGTVTIFNYKLVFKDISKCRAEEWKAMTCLVSIKPCSHVTNQVHICRSDCISLLKSCLDQSKMDNFKAAERVCADLLPNDNQNGCVSVKDYTKPPSEKVSLQANTVSLPCSPNPCESGETCVVNRKCLRATTSPTPCKMYTCFSGCTVDGQNKLTIPIGTVAKLVQRTAEESYCFHVCECSINQHDTQSTSSFTKCKSFGCERKDACKLYGREHGEMFYRKCNLCTCSHGEIICTNRRCDQKETQRRDHDGENEKFDTPCACKSSYHPVCGSNGMTYPYTCFAK